MAFELGEWLTKHMEEKGGDGKPAYSAQTLQDFMSLVMLSGSKQLDGLNESMQKTLGSFLIRSGLDKVEAKQFKATLEKYFAAHPLPKDLIASFQHEFRRAPIGKSLGKLVRTIRG